MNHPPSTRLYTIPFSAPFLDTLARGILRRYGENPLTLSRITLLLPNRRSCRSLRDAFLRQTEGRALLLPAMRAIGDSGEEMDTFFLPSPLEGEGWVGGLLKKGLMQETPSPCPLPQGEGGVFADIPLAVSAIKRQMLLAGMIQEWGGKSGAEISIAQASRLAYDLAAFLDEAQRYDIPLDKLPTIVPDELAEHWQVTLEFFGTLSHTWPEMLRKLGQIDPIVHRNRLLERQVEMWRAFPPEHPVITAGSTGSTPATRKLLRAITEMEQGAVILPGLDKAMVQECWEKLEPQHPQYALRELLRALEVEREDVDVWCHPEPKAKDFPPQGILRSAQDDSPRERFLSEVMRPAEGEASWQDSSVSEDAIISEDALAMLSRLDAPTMQEEAGAIALLLRAQLEKPEKTAALVTPDRDIAERVRVQLRRWEITVDDSAGRPLAQTPPVVFLMLVAEMVAADFAPVPMLAALKHPLASGGMETAKFRASVRAFEKAVLHGIRVGQGFEGFRAALKLTEIGDAEKAESTTWLDALERTVEELARLFQAKDKVASGALLMSHIRVAEQLAATEDMPESGTEHLWAGEEGRQAAEWVATLEETLGEGSAYIEPRLYPNFFETLWLGQNYRPRYGSHPRIAILSPMEARLQRYDLMILAGLNEGNWPAARDSAWMSRKMRAEFGLPSAEFYMGQAARDFVECASAPEVMLTRSEKVYGTPTLPSPWLLRMDALLAAKGWQGKLRPALPWLEWSRAIYWPDAIAPIAPPEPRPPVSARPVRLSVTQVETWMRDPYAIYARHILKLRPLDELDKDPDAADYGTLLHRILEVYVRGLYEGGDGKKDHPSTINHQLSTLLEIGRQEFQRLSHIPAVKKLWWPRFERIAGCFVEHELARRACVRKVWLEQKGTVIMGGFTLSAKADRIELATEGGLRIVDYKTGNIPTKISVEKGLSPQLTLTALIVGQSGFPEIDAANAVRGLEYWKLSTSGLEDKPVFDLTEAKHAHLLEETRERFLNLVNAFSNASTPYLACPDASATPKYNDYAHLERIGEWGITEQGNEP